MHQRLVPSRETRSGVSAGVTAVLALALVAMALSAPAAATSSIDDTNTTVPLQSSSQPFWAGQQLHIDAPASDGGTDYELYRVSGDNGEFHVEAFVTQVTLDAEGDAVIDTGQELIGQGSYVVLDEDGNAVVFAADGTVDQRLDSRAVTGAEFAVRAQTVSAELDDSTVTPGTTTSLEINSNRPTYAITVSSPSLSASQVQSLLGSERLQVQSIEQSVGVDTDGIPEGTYNLTLDVTDTTASDTVTLTVDEDANDESDDVTDPSEPAQDPLPLQTGGTPYWTGQQLFFDAPDSEANVNYALHTVRQDGDALRPGDFITQITLDDSGDSVLRTGRSIIEPGEYVILDGDGDAVVFAADGTTAERLNTSNVTGATFSVRDQALDVTVSSPVQANSNTTLTLQSNRGAYTVNISSPDLAAGELQTMFGGTTVAVDNVDKSLDVTVPDLSNGTYNVTFDVVDTTASETVTLTVGADSEDDTDYVPSDDQQTVPVESSANPFWAGQQLRLDAPDSDAGLNYALHRVLEEDGGYDVAEFVTQITLNDSGDAVIDTGQEPIGQGSYVVLDEDGNAVVFAADGTVEQRLDSRTVTGAEFAVREQALDATFEESTVSAGETVSLTLASTRAQYNVTVSSSALSESQLQTLLGSSSFEVQSTDSNIVVTIPELPSGTYDLTFDVVDSTATATATLTVDGWSPGELRSRATNLDDDPLLEDVDGDGKGDIFDVLTYYTNRQSDDIRNNPDVFDFDGDGTAGTLFDALALYNELS